MNQIRTANWPARSHMRNTFDRGVAKPRSEIFSFEALTTTLAGSSKSSILSLCVKTIRAEKTKVQFAYFVQRD